ncbi:cytochrome P450, family 71, subfamily B, polypeptide 13 [Hibiscus trionum]|uniref:Cytochrome P450, family 71, subfamily B, polypeptide 13 n=1 Tax=Hibiscus trionum TaxID=183268 RepID=A0A9W7IEY3_HIBTR|nr:cytochrome P450, family 71, subfamily B, polypeptide 13 [Hibiscus trionum]
MDISNLYFTTANPILLYTQVQPLLSREKSLLLINNHYSMDFHFILTLSLIALTLFVLKNKARTKRLPPGPWKLPLIGNLHQLGDSPHKSIQRLSRKYGPMMFLQLGAVPTLVISSADAAMAIFKGGSGHDVVFSGRPNDLCAAKKFSYNLNSISFAPYGDLWREMRKIAIVELLSSKRVQSFRTVREEEVAEIVKHIASTSSTVNLSKLSMLLANNVVCRVAFGKKYGGDGEGSGGKSRFDAVMHETQVLLGEFFVSDYFPWMWWVNKFNGVEARVEKCFKELDKFYDEVIEDHLVPTRSKLDHEDIVDVLLRLQKDPSQVISINNQQIKGILTDMFLAGTDTTASTLIWIFTELIRNPACMQKVQAEVRKVATGRHKIEECDLPKLNYLQLVIKEALRLHPPAPLSVPRETTEDCIIGDYEIPAKTRTIMDLRSIGTDPKYWENPNEFRPERFMNSSVDFKGQHFELLPFGVGRRGCPGSNFAIVLVQLAVANFCNQFDWELPDGMSVEDVDMEEEIGITMFKKTPLCLVPTRIL